MSAVASFLRPLRRAALASPLPRITQLSEKRILGRCLCDLEGPGGWPSPPSSLLPSLHASPFRSAWPSLACRSLSSSASAPSPEGQLPSTADRKEDLEKKIGELETQIKDIDEEIKDLKAEIRGLGTLKIMQ